MKFTAKRLLAAGAIGISAIVTPIALTVALPGIGSVPSAVAGATTGTPTSPDEILYGQTTGNPATYFEYVPGNGSQPTTQPVTPNGKCSSPGVSDPNGPLLAVSGKEYTTTPDTTDYYNNASSNDPAGMSSLQTGACNISPNWTLDNKVGKGAEALDFAPGDQAVIGSNRIFTQALIPIQRKDSGVAQHPTVTVDLVEYDSTGTKYTQTCSINGGSGTGIMADTNTSDANNPCTGTAAPASGFASVEVQDLTASSSISVVGPIATFKLASAICGGGHLNTPSSDTVNATLYLTGSSTQCKTYTNFSSSINSQTNSPILNFNGYSTQPVTFTVKITWPLQPECQPYNDAGVPADLTLPMCAPHEISVDGTNYFDQAYCQSPNTAAEQPQGGMCTVDKTYNNDTETIDPNTGAVTGTQGLVLPNCTPSAANNNCAATQLTEIWVGDIDMWWK